MSAAKGKNLCLRCPHQLGGKCRKMPTDYCMYTKSTSIKNTITNGKNNY